MKKILKLGILFLAVFALAAAIFAAVTLLKDDTAEEGPETVFSRTELDAASVFGDYVFEEKVRQAVGLGKNEEIDLAGLASVTELDLTYTGSSTTSDSCVLSLDGLKYFTGLTRLVIDGNDVKNLDPVSYCKDLISFSAQGCSLTDEKAGAVRKLPGLVFLNLKANSLSDLSFLSYLPKLRILNIGQNELTDDGVFAEISLPELKTLYINASGLSSIENIARLRTLEYLDISGLSLYDADIACLRNLTNLTTVVCRSNTVRKGTVFAELPNLRSLDLYNNEISDLSNLAGCAALEELDVSANLLYKLTGIENLTSLKRLTAYNNHISSFGVLERMEGLEYIKVDNENYCKGE